jgi:hypothetical protein
VGPVAPVKPVGPVAPVAPVFPVGPVAPTGPVGPVSPVVPAVPEGPIPPTEANVMLSVPIIIESLVPVPTAFIMKVLPTLTVPWTTNVKSPFVTSSAILLSKSIALVTRHLVETEPTLVTL